LRLGTKSTFKSVSDALFCILPPYNGKCEDAEKRSGLCHLFPVARAMEMTGEMACSMARTLLALGLLKKEK
jgi:hypothetical protein